MRPYVAASLLLLALPAWAQEIPLALRRTGALTQRPLELGVTAGLARSTSSSLPDFHTLSVPVALELGVSERVELHLFAVAFRDDDGDTRGVGPFLRSAGGGIGVQLAASRDLAVSTALDVTLPRGDTLDWILTPSLASALVWRHVLVEGRLELDLAHTPAITTGPADPDQVLVLCRTSPCEGGSIAGMTYRLGGALAVSWVAGALLPGLRLDASGRLASPQAPSDRTTSPVAVTYRDPGAAVHLGPQLGVLASEHVLLRLAVPVGLTRAAQDWSIVATVRVDAELAAADEDRFRD